MYGIDEDYTRMKTVSDVEKFVVCRQPHAAPLISSATNREMRFRILICREPSRRTATARFVSLMGSFDTNQVDQAADMILQAAEKAGNHEMSEYTSNLRAVLNNTRLRRALRVCDLRRGNHRDQCASP
jgi:hypothetical protein